MNEKIEAQFQTLAEKLISDAEKIKCDHGDFVEGLELVSSFVSERLSLAHEEQAAKDK